MNINSTIVSNRGLSNEQLLKSAPSIFATKAHPSRSERYAYIPTINVLNNLRKAGFVPVQAFQSATHTDIKNRAPFAKHLIRLRERKWLDADLKKDALIPDVILTNSHNGKSSFQLEAGLYRLVCSNGLIIKAQGFGSIKVSHAGKVVEKVAEGVTHIIEYVPEIMRVTKEWDKIKLTERQQKTYAKRALEMRFHGEPPITVEQALEARRVEDQAPTLWRTFNVLQENLLSGGIAGNSASGRGVTTRLVKSVNNSLRYNRCLWQLAEAFAKKV